MASRLPYAAMIKKSRESAVSRLSRRDFLEGVLLAAGGAAVGSFFPLQALAATGEPDPRMLRGGNLPSTFSVGHWLRDGRLSFAPTAVTLAPSAMDSRAG